ncbi:hypothetical protein AXK11_04075 [Cephaloticoccus primus]|uniref:Uncharacterized protein n=1 Tax=Cephaloticoccus primus TaxID=1548207 RepID=A0A139SPP7_9BACT|nr:polysaccharide biosynthesis/export family protein [Cephaloticoccus primus]KXU36537.1 hypothetical protein AXK11_04075 [Cephaloticoccus primus]
MKRLPCIKALCCLLALLASSLIVHGQSRQRQHGGPAQPSTAQTYRIATNDSLRVVVFQEPDLEITARIDASGMVNLPLLGQIRISGLTIPEAERAIATAYQNERYLRDPQITISIVDYAPREVSIQGQVRSPGRYPIPVEHPLTLVELVTRAGGFTDVARGTAVTVTRVNSDGTRQIFTVDVASLIRGRSRASTEDNALVLLPGDIVYVPERII